jgi:hypothetical protein
MGIDGHAIGACGPVDRFDEEMVESPRPLVRSAGSIRQSQTDVSQEKSQGSVERSTLESIESFIRASVRGRRRPQPGFHEANPSGENTGYGGVVCPTDIFEGVEEVNAANAS